MDVAETQASLPFDLRPWPAVLEESSVANNMVGAHLQIIS